MRHAIIYAVSSFLLAITVTAIPETPFSPYLGPLLHQLFGINSIYDISNEQNSSATNVERELRRRQGIDIDIDEDLCPDDFNPCVALGAPGLCCEENQNCALDNAGRVACCPEGAVCTGIIDLPAPTDAANTITDFVLASTAGGGVVINVGTATEGFVVETELAESAAEARLMVCIDYTVNNAILLLVFHADNFP